MYSLREVDGDTNRLLSQFMVITESMKGTENSFRKKGHETYRRSRGSSVLREPYRRLHHLPAVQQMTYSFKQNQTFDQY